MNFVQEVLVLADMSFHPLPNKDLGLRPWKSTCTCSSRSFTWKVCCFPLKIKWNGIISVSISMAAKVTVQADEDMFNIETGATLTRYDISRYPERFATRKLPGWSTMSRKGGLECERRVERCITCPERPWWLSSGICSESAARNRKSPQRSTKTEVPQVEPTSWGTYRNKLCIWKMKTYGKKTAKM